MKTVMADNVTPFPTRSGFAGQLSGTSISDLIQLHCMSRADATYELSSGGDIGLLVFSAGNLVHAETAGLEGEVALERMLRWGHGRFSPCSTAQERRRTINAPWQSVLLRLAHAEDESREAKSDRVSARPTSRPATNEKTSHSAREKDLDNEDVPGPPPPLGVPCAVRVSREGQLKAAHGPGREALAETVSYVTTLARILGEELGLGSERALDMSYESGKTLVIRRETTGSWLGMVGSAQQVRDTLERFRRR